MKLSADNAFPRDCGRGRYGALWDDDALAALDVLWQADSLQEALDEWLEIARRLDSIAEDARNGDEEAQRQWRHLERKQQSVEDASLSNANQRRLTEKMP